MTPKSSDTQMKQDVGSRNDTGRLRKVQGTAHTRNDELQNIMPCNTSHVSLRAVLDTGQSDNVGKRNGAGKMSGEVE